MRRHLLAALFVLASPAVAAAEPSLEGQWIGGFQSGALVVGIDVRFIAGASGLSGEMNVPQRAAWAMPLQRITQRGARVGFELTVARGHIQFDGWFDDAGHVTGTVRQGSAGTSRFELFRLATPTPAELRGIAGTYRWGDDHVILVAPGTNGIIYVDYESGRTGTLYAVGRDRFVAGATMSTGYPIALDLTFSRDAHGVGETATIMRNGKRVQARRATFYHQEPVTFPSGDVTIAGTLLRPIGSGPHPALVMIHGSGPVTRDPLRRFADHFARHGVAVLITDKRGTGSSTGSWTRATFDDLAADALAGVGYLRNRSDIEPSAVGLHGASAGGWVAPLAASRSSEVAFVIVESAPTVTPMQHERLRVDAQLRADGFSRAEIARALALMDLKFEVARTGQDWPRLQTLMKEAAHTAWLGYTNPPSSLVTLRWDWDHVYGYDPLPALARLDVPVLAIYGGRDTIVPPRVHRTRMASLLRATERGDVAIKVFDKANHGFLEAATGGRVEYPGLTSFVDGYFEQRTAWVVSTVRARMSRARTDAPP